MVRKTGDKTKFRGTMSSNDQCTGLHFIVSDIRDIALMNNRLCFCQGCTNKTELIRSGDFPLEVTHVTGEGIYRLEGTELIKSPYIHL